MSSVADAKATLSEDDELWDHVQEEGEEDSTEEDDEPTDDMLEEGGEDSTEQDSQEGSARARPHENDTLDDDGAADAVEPGTARAPSPADANDGALLMEDGALMEEDDRDKEVS